MSCKTTNSRNAFTLLELLLVLAILAALAAMVIPSFESMVSSRRLQQSVDQLQNDLMQGRVTAMRTGQAQVFQCVIGSSEYSVKPWLSGNESQNASAGATLVQGGQAVKTDTNGAGGVTTQAVSTDKETVSLKEGVQIQAVETLVDTRNALAIQQGGQTVGAATSNAAGSTSSPLLIYPDGSSTMAQITLVDARGRRIAVQIRGITGTITNIKLTNVDPSTLATVPK